MLYYTVHEDWQGEIAVSSFLGKSKAEEKRNALNGSKAVHLITTDHDRAQRYAEDLRRAAKPARR